MYKSCHPDDTDEPGDVGGSSEDEAAGMEEVLGITSRLYKPSPDPPSPAPEPTSSVLEDEKTVRVPKKGLKWAAKLLQDLSVSKKVRIPASASRDEVPFEVPDVRAGDTDCALCHQTFKSTRVPEVAYENPYWGNRSLLLVQEDPCIKSNVGAA